MSNISYFVIAAPAFEEDTPDLIDKICKVSGSPAGWLSSTLEEAIKRSEVYQIPATIWLFIDGKAAWRIK